MINITLRPITIDVSTFEFNVPIAEEKHDDGFGPYISIILFSILTVILNLLVISVISYFRNLRSRNSNKFLLNLMLSNSCIGLVMLCFGSAVVAFNSTRHTFNNHSKPPASISLMFGVLILLSVMNMILVSADRLYAVKWTYRYFDSTNSKLIYIVIILPWVISLIYFIILITMLQSGNDYTKDIAQHIIYISFDVVALLGFFILTVSSTVIYKQTRIQLDRISRTSVVVQSSAKQKQKNLLFRKLRLAVINVGLVIKFVVFWLPTLATMTYHLTWEKSTSEFVEYFTLHLVLLNCLCDPTVYVFLSRDIRRSIRVLVFKEENADLLPASTRKTNIEL